MNIEPRQQIRRSSGRDNVILTPHTAFYSVEALEELQTKCASDVARAHSGEKAVYPISA
jgi:D-3-phosphoglycerate dehydrogenase / 2-oxoglutarate reductase